MKTAVSVSLGTPLRDFSQIVEIAGQQVLLRRQGTGGSQQLAHRLLSSLDGQVDALGLGGVNRYLIAGSKRFPLRSGQSLARVVRQTPLVDGEFVKQVSAQQVIHLLQRAGIQLHGQTVLITSVLDRWSLAQALDAAGCRLLIGDALFALRLPIVFHSLRLFELVACWTLPLLGQLPIEWLYPVGKRQETILTTRNRWFAAADIVAGDFHFIRRYLPPQLAGKTVITSTLTDDDLHMLRSRGVTNLVTATGPLGNRFPGANAWEAALVAALGLSHQEVTPARLNPYLQETCFQPRLYRLND